MITQNNSAIIELNESTDSTDEGLSVRYIDFMKWPYRLREKFVMTNFGDSPAFVQSGLLKAVH